MIGAKLNTRISGFIYLGLIAVGIFYLAYAPGQLIDWDSATETVSKLIQFDGFFRLFIGANIVGNILFLALALTLYETLKSSGQFLAVVMITTVAIAAAIGIAATANLFVVLDILSDETAVVADNSTIMDNLSAYYRHIHVNKVLWGIWLFPLGILALRSRIIPKFLAYFLLIGCFGYLVNFSLGLFQPQLDGSFVKRAIGLPATIGEIGTALWLTIVGVRPDLGSVVGHEPG